MNRMFPTTETGVPYNITVRASTGVGKREPVSVIAFAVQQGNFARSSEYIYIVW